MTFLKRFSFAASLLLLTTFYSCSKNVDATIASTASGTYKGVISLITADKTFENQYTDYEIKIEPCSGDKVIVSCVSEPKAFENFELKLQLQNDAVCSINSCNRNICYTVSSSQLQLNIDNCLPTAAFTGFRK